MLNLAAYYDKTPKTVIEEVEIVLKLLKALWEYLTDDEKTTLTMFEQGFKIFIQKEGDKYLAD